MPSGFYRTTNNSVGIDPTWAIEFVTGAKNPDRLKDNLIEALYYEGQGDSIVMPRNDEPAFAWPNFCASNVWGVSGIALLMNGTTAELQQMLRVAKFNGVEGFKSTGDCLVVWYLRRKAGTETKSLVLVAPKYTFLRASYDDPARNADYQANSWHFMGVSKTEGQDIAYTGLSLSWLMDEVLPQGRNVTAWY